MQRMIGSIWMLVLVSVVLMLSFPQSRETFARATAAQPYGMGFLKIALLGTMGELLGARIAMGRWRLRGIRLSQRALVWGFLGLVFTLVFPLFSFGVDGLLRAGLLPGHGSALLAAAWSSILMNSIFAFPMMVFHRVTDNLIDEGRLLSAWPLVEVLGSIDWRNMVRVVGLSCIWFWMPAHTFTFTLPAELRVVCAALLAVALGAILGLAKRMAQQQQEA